jgi:hypothetical protein
MHNAVWIDTVESHSARAAIRSSHDSADNICESIRHAICKLAGCRHEQAAKEGNMTKRFFVVLAVAGVMAVATPLFVTVQAAEVRCQIPFSFAVNGTMLPAGTYNLSTTDSALLIRGMNHGAVTLSTRMESRTETDAKLIFEKRGDTYTLRQVWMGEGTGRELPQTRTEKDKRLALGPAERVVIFAM